MPVNKKESLIYTILMVFMMASVMTMFNISMHDGFNIESLKKAWLVFPLTATIAFLVEWFFVSKTAFALISKFVKKEDPLPRKILVSALCFVTQMVLLMSILTSLVFNDFNENWLSQMFVTIARNFVVAYLLQVLIAGPLVGTIFRKLFPLGTIVVLKK